MKLKQHFRGMGPFLALWSTQAFSGLGSMMTSYALIVWSYQQQGSALATALLSICSYAPYVLLSIFAGALSDRWDKRRTMLACDTLAAATTVAVLVLLRSGRLALGHRYLLNALNGFMNTVQEPAASVAVSLIAPQEHYQKVGGLRAFSDSLTKVLAPVFASALFGLGGIELVVLFDLASFSLAFFCLVFFIRIPPAPQSAREGGGPLHTAREGLAYLRRERGILHLILFLACINLVASMCDAALPAMLLSRKGAGAWALALVSACTGLANVAGSLLVLLRRPPQSRVRVICNALLFSMSTENLLLALGRSAPVWCLGAVLGWLAVPIMNANMEVLLRLHIPVEIQGRVYAARNTLQFFTIPVGQLLGGALIDGALEPWMARQPADGLLPFVLGVGKGSGAALLFLLLAGAGVAVCLVFRRDRHIWALERAPVQAQNTQKEADSI